MPFLTRAWHNHQRPLYVLSSIESGQPPQNRTEGFYDGVEVALERYNGVTAETTNGQMYRLRLRDKQTNIRTHHGQSIQI